MFSLIKSSFVFLFLSLTSLCLGNDLSHFTGLDQITSESGARMRAIRDEIGTDYVLLSQEFFNKRPITGPDFNGDVNFTYSLLDLTGQNLILPCSNQLRMSELAVVIKCKNLFFAPGAKLSCVNLTIEASENMMFLLSGIKTSEDLYLDCKKDLINSGGGIESGKNLRLSSLNMLNERLSDSDFEAVKAVLNA